MAATGRHEIDELFAWRPQGGGPCAGDDDEEVVTFHVAHEVRSYRELLMILYHADQGARRAAPRRVLRTREFTMKDLQLRS
jgi:hypothetical protein